MASSSLQGVLRVPWGPKISKFSKISKKFKKSKANFKKFKNFKRVRPPKGPKKKWDRDHRKRPPGIIDNSIRDHRK